MPQDQELLMLCKIELAQGSEFASCMSNLACIRSSRIIHGM